MESSLEREMREWRAARARRSESVLTGAALSSVPTASRSVRPQAERGDLERLFGDSGRRFAPGPSRRVQVRGQEVLVLQKPRRPLSS